MKVTETIFGLEAEFERGETYEGIDVVNFSDNTITTYFGEKDSNLHDLAIEHK